MSHDLKHGWMSTELLIKRLLNIFKKIRKWDFLYYGNFQEMGGRVLVY